MEETTNALEVAAETTKQSINHFTEMLNSAAAFIRSILPTLVFALIVLVAGLFAVKLILKILMSSLQKSNIDPTVSGFLKSLIKILLDAIVFIIFLSLINVPMTSIITILGTAGLAIGLALKDSLSNVAGGFIILFTKPLKTGDTIAFDGAEGIVEQVGILYTTLRTFDNAVIYIPNGKISDGQIINYSAKDTRRVDLEYSVGYNCDIDKVRNVIKNILNESELVLKDPKADILVARHDESAIVIFVRPWVKTEDYWKVKFSLNEKIKKEFDKNNIEIPYPQLDIHNV